MLSSFLFAPAGQDDVDQAAPQRILIKRTLLSECRKTCWKEVRECLGRLDDILEVVVASSVPVNTKPLHVYLGERLLLCPAELKRARHWKTKMPRDCQALLNIHISGQ